MTRYLEQVNRVSVAPDLLGEVMEMHANMPAEDRSSFEARAFRIFELLTGHGFRGKKRVDLSVAIDFRLTALARLTKARGGRGFTIPGREEGMDWVHPDLVRCAAEEPLIEDEAEQSAFDLDRFEQRLLGICEIKGEA